MIQSNIFFKQQQKQKRQNILNDNNSNNLHSIRDQYKLQL